VSSADQLPRQQSRRRRATTGLLLAALLVLGLGSVFVVEPFAVASSSMTPTLHDGDEVLGEKVGPRLGRVGRDDVVVFTAPGTRALLVKRVAAVGGDEVGLEDGVLVVNGRPVPESYVDHDTVDGVYFGPVTVPAGAVFVLGDDRAESVDSRVFGSVPLDRVVARVLIRLG
jgi:signal peptidase I